jgi:hypothetical protein
MQYADTRIALDFAAITGPVYTPPPAGMLGAKWFQGRLMNFAHNLMPPQTDQEVLVCLSEGSQRPARRYTGKQLWHEV